MIRQTIDPDLEDIEIKLLLEGVYLHYGYDFREYASSSLKRRIGNLTAVESARQAALHGHQGGRTVELHPVHRDAVSHLLTSLVCVCRRRSRPLR